MNSFIKVQFLVIEYNDDIFAKKEYNNSYFPFFPSQPLSITTYNSYDLRLNLKNQWCVTMTYKFNKLST
jgi:hypothetical protein